MVTQLQSQLVCLVGSLGIEPSQCFDDRFTVYPASIAVYLPIESLTASDWSPIQLLLARAYFRQDLLALLSDQLISESPCVNDLGAN